jgi:Flp pilus assembly protein TadD
MRALPYVSVAVWLFAGVPVCGQYPGRSNTSEFRGRLVEGTESSYENYVVELANLADRSNCHYTDVLRDGNFVFRAISDGDYQVRVLTLYGAEVTTTVTSVGQENAGFPFEIRLPQRKLEKPVSGTVSMQQLAHPPSRQIRKLLASGQQLIDDQHFRDAAARLREAVQDDPQCSQAHAQLGLALAKMEAWDGAIQEYRAAASLDPGNTLLHSNLSAVLASSKRFDEAETEAALALKLDPRNPRAHYVLAGALLQTHGPLQDVVTHLAAARNAFPSARSALATLCAKKNVQGCP